MKYDVLLLLLFELSWSAFDDDDDDDHVDMLHLKSSPYLSARSLLFPRLQPLHLNAWEAAQQCFETNR